MTIPAQITFSQQFLLDSLSSSRSTCSTRALVQPSSCAQSVDFIAGCSTSSLLNIYYSARFDLSICFLIFWQIYFYRPCASISHPILCYKFSVLHVEHLSEYTFRRKRLFFSYVVRTHLLALRLKETPHPSDFSFPLSYSIFRIVPHISQLEFVRCFLFWWTQLQDESSIKKALERKTSAEVFHSIGSFHKQIVV